MTSTGAPASWWFVARAAVRIGCRCRPMSAQAIAAYLRRGRPASDRREVFLRARAPYEPIASGTVASTVRRACRRAGIPEIGSHRLRHTTACEMVKAEVPLVRIGQVLRHRSLQSTAIYARVDVERLRPLAAPWPGDDRAMSALSEHVDEYLRLRRALGFKLERARAAAPSTRRLSRGRRREHGHARAGDRVGPTARRRCIRTSGRRGCRSRAGSPPTCRRSTRAPRSRRSECSPSATSARPRTCGPSRTSAGCSKRAASCARR